MKLIIQGFGLQNEQIHTIAQLSKTQTYTQTSDNSWRFENVNELNIEEIHSLCDSWQADYALMPDMAQLSDYKLLAMDMDSTFIQIECIDEIADAYGLKEKVAAITESSMRGELDFNESLIQRVALLEGLDENALQKVYDERLRLSPGAEEMLAGLQKFGIKTLLVSGGFTFFTEKLKEKCNLDYTHANTLEVKNGVLTGKVIGTIINAEEKANTLLAVCKELNISPKNAIAMGDGANDLNMMQCAGLSVAYHAKPKVKAAADVAINYAGLDALLNLFL